MKRSLIFCALVLMVSLLSGGAYAAKIVLPESTPIKVRFDQSLEINSGKVEKGMELPIVLAEDIKIGGKTVIEAGASGKAEVVEAEGNSRPGNPGYIKIAFLELEPKGEYKTGDGSPIMLSGFEENKGKGKKLLSFIFIFGLFISGSEGEIDTALDYTATIKETVILETQ